MYDIIIIGAGPAGLSAALFALRANKTVLVIEASNYGGKIVNAHKIENYPGIVNITGYDFATNLYNQVKNLGCEIHYETALRIEDNKMVITNKAKYQAKAIIIATGLVNKKLNIPEEDKYLGKGLSYCAVCDGNFFRNKTVAVVGGGDNAMDDAIYLADLATKVYVINHGSELKATELLKDKVNSLDNVEVFNNVEVTEIIGENKVESIKLSDGKTIEVGGIFIAIGFTPSNKAFSNVVTLNEKGYIVTTDGVRTNVKGIYVAGDNRVKELRQLTTAVNDGSIAATIAVKEINENII